MIDGQQSYSIIESLQNTDVKINAAQLLAIAPNVRKELRSGLRRTVAPATAVHAERRRHTALHGDVSIDGKKYEVIFDTGASNCVFPEHVAKATGRPIVHTGHTVNTANGPTKILGRIEGVLLK